MLPYAQRQRRLDEVDTLIMNGIFHTLKFEKMIKLTCDIRYAALKSRILRNNDGQVRGAYGEQH